MTQWRLTNRRKKNRLGIRLQLQVITKLQGRVPEICLCSSRNTKSIGCYVTIVYVSECRKFSILTMPFSLINLAWWKSQQNFHAKAKHYITPTNRKCKLLIVIWIWIKSFEALSTAASTELRCGSSDSISCYKTHHFWTVSRGHIIFEHKTSYREEEDSARCARGMPLFRS